MKTIIKKMSKLGLLKFEFAIGVLTMAAGFIMLPVGIISVDPSMLLEPIVWGIVGGGMLFFALVGYFLFIRPYFMYQKMPEVLAESDGEYMYIHGKKEGKIPLNKLADAVIYVDLPFIYQKEFVREILIHIFSERYGTIILEIPDYGTYKLRFVSYAQETADELIDYIREVNGITF